MRIPPRPRRLAFVLTLALACLVSGLSPSLSGWLPRSASAASPSAAQEENTAIPSLSAQGLLDLVRANGGKAILINFFATWCPPCREEIPDLIKLRNIYTEKDLLIIGVSLDENAEKLRSFKTTTKFNYPIYRATDEIAPIVGISSIPHNMIYDRQGQLVVSEAGMLDAASLRTFMDVLLKDTTPKSDKSGGTKK